MRVKICGITRLKDAEAAVALGAWALGFIFYEKSPRYIAPEKAKKIIQALPKKVRKVGVFVDEDAKTIRAVKKIAGIDTIQLHGNESPELTADLGRRVIKALALTRPQDLERLAAFPTAAAFLIDAYSPLKKGGTGKKANWELAQAAKKYGRVILAGGINEKNVTSAIATVGPWALDLSSGVESRPGIKDKKKLRAFFKQVTP